MKVLRVLELAKVYTMRESYSTEVYRRIIWAILHKGRCFFNKKLLSTAFMSGRMVDYSICLLNILDKVHNVELIQRSTYPQAWLTNREQLRQGHPPIPPMVPLPLTWLTPQTLQVHAGTPRQNQAAQAVTGGGQQGSGHQGQRGDNGHPRIKALMDLYLAVNTGQLNITRLLNAVNKRYEDLPTLPNYTNLQRHSSICWNWVLGCCGYGRACIFQCGQVKQDDILDTFVDAVYDVIGKGVVQLINNGGGNVPQPPPNKKPKLGTDMPQPEE